MVPVHFILFPKKCLTDGRLNNTVDTVEALSGCRKPGALEKDHGQLYFFEA